MTAKQRPAADAFKLILNWDGGPTGFSHYPMAPEQLAHWAVGQFADTQIDAVSWCASEDGNTASWKSDQFELYGEVSNFTDYNAQQWRYMANVKHMVDRGIDPPAVIAEACKRHGMASLFSLRVNDIHDAHGGMAVPKVKREHPEWMHGEGHSAATGLDYTRFEVREYKKALVREFFEKFDFDALELDWLRTDCNLPDLQGYQHRYAITDWVADLRAMLDEMGRQRGRPIRIAVRVPETVEGCRLAGLDAPEWVARRLIDHLILGNGAVEYRLDPWRDMCRDAGVRVYPCLYGWCNDYGPNLIRPPCNDEVVRGTAARTWQQHPDGLYMFNMYPTEGFRMDLMRQIGAPETLAGTDKRFAAEVSSRDPVHYKNLWYYAPLPVRLERTHGPGPTIPITVTDDVAGAARDGKLASVAIEISFHQVTQELDEIELAFNGRPLRREGTILPKTLLGHGTDLVLAYGHETWVLHPAPESFNVGCNELVVTLKHRNPAVTSPLEIHRCEIVVKYT